MSQRWIMATAVLLAAGCARLPTATTTKESNPLPPARMSADAVVLQVAKVRLPAADTDEYEGIWREIDEQALPAPLRRELANNGLRAGVVGQQIPAKLREQLDSKASTLEERSRDVNAGDAENSSGSRRLHARAGHRSELFASKTYPTLALLLVENGSSPDEAPILRGHQLRDAQCQLALKAYPQGDGRVKLEVTPEVAYGDSRSQWVRGDGGTLMQVVGRERIVVDRLRMEATIAPGESLVLSTMPEIKGLGEYFFAETAGGRVQRTFLLIRLAQTQFDDLFAPDRSAAPLATPGE